MGEEELTELPSVRSQRGGVVTGVLKSPGSAATLLTCSSPGPTESREQIEVELSCKIHKVHPHGPTTTPSIEAATPKATSLSLRDQAHTQTMVLF